MFTGIIEEVGTVLSLKKQGHRARLVVEARNVLEGTGIGDSVAVDGVCQTVTEILPGAFAVDTLAETLKKTTLGGLVPGRRVNLERALRADSRLGGHFVQGHVSAPCPIREITCAGDNVYISVELPEELLRYCVREGSIALDGVSLTVAELAGTLVRINVIPLTLEKTALGRKRAGDLVNVETDIIGRYVERLLAPWGQGKLTPERMKELGY